jgi:hypothetical protein
MKQARTFAESRNAGILDTQSIQIVRMNHAKRGLFNIIPAGATPIAVACTQLLRYAPQPPPGKVVAADNPELS